MSGLIWHSGKIRYTKHFQNRGWKTRRTDGCHLQGRILKLVALRTLMHVQGWPLPTVTSTAPKKYVFWETQVIRPLKSDCRHCVTNVKSVLIHLIPKQNILSERQQRCTVSKIFHTPPPKGIVICATKSAHCSHYSIPTTHPILVSDKIPSTS